MTISNLKQIYLVHPILIVIWQDRIDGFIPIVIHNGANYDWHLLIRELLKYKKFEIKPIAKTASKFISFKWGIFHFIDSRRFLNASEEKLANQLANRKEDGTEKVN